MVNIPSPLLLDTNIFIFGYLNPESTSGRILRALSGQTIVQVVLSNELMAQIQRVGRRVGGKDWAGQLLNVIWQEFAIMFVIVSDEDKRHLNESSDIPREDVGVYLTALQGQIACMVSANHEFVRQAAAKQKLFECLTPEEFVTNYLSTS